MNADDFHTGHPIPELLELPLSDADWIAAVDAESDPRRELRRAAWALADQLRGVSDPRRRVQPFYDVLRDLSKRSFLAFHSLRAALWSLEKRGLGGIFDDHFCIKVVDLAQYELEATLVRVKAIRFAEGARQ